MIEIIREEEWDRDEKRSKTLPKDIRQIGRPDSGDRVYVENQAYQFLRSANPAEEKTAFVLLGRFEEFDGKWCTFIEAAICLEEMQFEGGLPIWTDHTWAYIFKNLNKKHDDMAIAGCAIDFRGSLPEMNVRLEAIHQKNFGGPHQVMLLMDTLEKEEVFYGNYNGRLYRKDGFYIYYDRNLPENMKLNMQRQQEEPVEAREFVQEVKPPVDFVKNQQDSKKERQKTKRRKDSRHKNTVKENQIVRKTDKNETDRKEIEREKTERKETEQEARKPERIEKNSIEEAWKTDGRPGFERSSAQSGQYRERLKAKSKRPSMPSYVPSAALVAIVCFMGFAAFQNQRKVNQMEEALNRSKNQVSQDKDDNAGDVKVETVSGNVKPQDTQAAVLSDHADEGQENGELPIQTAENQAGTDIDPAMNVQSGPDAITDTLTDVAVSETPAPETNTSETGITDTDAADGDISDTDTPEENTPDTGMADTDAAMAEAKTYLEQGYYIVQKGDNLVGICRKIYQTTAMLDKLCEVNHIEDRDAIYAGQYLTLPN